MKLIIVLCVFIGHVCSVPNPCIDLCGSISDSIIKTSESHQTYEKHNSFSNINGLSENEFLKSKQEKPTMNLGEWTANNDYKIDNIADIIHEERKQLDDGKSKLNYHIKNYIPLSSTGLLSVNNAGKSNILGTLDRLKVPNYNVSASSHEQNIHVINYPLDSSSTDNLTHLKNFEEMSNMDTPHHDNKNSGVMKQNGDVWTRRNNYVTDGGNGKLYVEEGQYNQGPAKVRYYKTNYVSSFGTIGDNGNIPMASNFNTQLSPFQPQAAIRQLQEPNNPINQQMYTDINRQYNYPPLNPIPYIHSRLNLYPSQQQQQYQSQQNGQSLIYAPSSQTYGSLNYGGSVLPCPQNYEFGTHNGNMNGQIMQPGYQRMDNTNLEHGTIRYRRSADFSQHSEDLTQQANQHSGFEDLTQQHTENLELEQQQTHQYQDSVQRAQHGFDEFSQQSTNLGLNQQQHENVGQLEFGQQTQNQHYYDRYGQIPKRFHQPHRNPDLSQQSTHGFDDYTQQPSTNLGFDQQQHENEGQLEFGRQTQNQHYHDRYSQFPNHVHQSHGNPDLSQQSTHGFDDYTQQQSYNLHLNQQQHEIQGQLESRQQTQSNRYLNHYIPHSQQNGFEDYSQQGGYQPRDSHQSSHRYDDLTQQHTGNLQLHQQHIQVDHDSAQRTEHGFSDFSQQPGNSRRNHYQQQNGKLEFEQQTHNHDNYGQFESQNVQQQSGSLEFGKPQDYHRTEGYNYNQQTRNHYDDISQQQTQRHLDIGQSHESIYYGQQKGDNLTQQTYSNFENGHRINHNNDDLSQTHEPLRPASKPMARPHRHGQHEISDTQVEPHENPSGVKGGRRTWPKQQSEFSSHYTQITENPSDGVLSLEQQVKQDEPLNIESRLLEVYGGNGIYNSNHSEKIFDGVRINPSVTLPTISNGPEPWEIREVEPLNDYVNRNSEAEPMISETTFKLNQDYVSTTVAPGFWKKIGNKITNTFQQTKKKVNDIFT